MMRLKNILLLLLLWNNSSFAYSINQEKTKIYEVEKIIIFYTPFEIKLRTGIKYNQIEKKAQFKLVYYFPESTEFKNSNLVLQYIKELPTKETILMTNLIVRAKLIFKLKGTRKSIVLFIGEDKMLYYNNICYGVADKFN